ncbi:MAG: DnaA ATPase domain-containing protein, partial [Thermodesulfobacteriota bacterium]
MEKLSNYEENQTNLSYNDNEYQPEPAAKGFNWLKVLSRLKEKSNPQVSFWFSSLNFLGRDKNSITLQAKNNFDRDWINNHYINFICETINEVYEGDFEVNLTSNQAGSVKNKAVNLDNGLKAIPDRFVPISGSLNSNYTFESFIVGSSNQFAHAASIAAAQRPGEAYNPLFIHGGVGLGKTHLINAIGNYALQNSSNKLRVCCISAERFT